MCGAFVASCGWFKVQWPASWLDVAIAQKELVPVVIAAAVWGRDVMSVFTLTTWLLFLCWSIGLQRTSEWTTCSAPCFSMQLTINSIFLQSMCLGCWMLRQTPCPEIMLPSFPILFHRCHRWASQCLYWICCCRSHRIGAALTGRHRSGAPCSGSSTQHLQRLQVRHQTLFDLLPAAFSFTLSSAWFEFVSFCIIFV